MPIHGYASVTHSAGSVTTASGTVLAANTSRKYGLLINDSDTVVYLAFGGAAVANQGIRVNGNGGNYEMSALMGNVYTGRIEAIHNGSGTKIMLITEGV